MRKPLNLIEQFAIASAVIGVVAALAFLVSATAGYTLGGAALALWLGALYLDLKGVSD